MIDEILTVVVVGLMLFISLRAVKSISGGILHGIMVFVSLYLVYFILVNVIYVKKIPPIKLPSIFHEIDDEVEQRYEEFKRYEYRKIR